MVIEIVGRYFKETACSTRAKNNAHDRLNRGRLDHDALRSHSRNRSRTSREINDDLKSSIREHTFFVMRRLISVVAPESFHAGRKEWSRTMSQEQNLFVRHFEVGKCGRQLDEKMLHAFSFRRDTLVFVGPVAFGLTLHELGEEVEVKYEWNSPVRYVRVSDAPPKRRRAWAHPETTYKRHMPCGRMALHAYSRYGRATWERRWQESTAGQLAKKFKTIIRELQSAAPEIVKVRDEAEKRAQAEHRRWEAERRELEQEERARRRAEALKESRQQLVEIVDA